MFFYHCFQLSNHIPNNHTKARFILPHTQLIDVLLYFKRVLGVYTMEPVIDFDWNILSYAILMIYHFIFLKIFAVVRLNILFEFQVQDFNETFSKQPTQVNLNHMLCPAILDPFEGQNYRIAAIIHQGILCPLLCKLMCLLFVPRKFTENTSNNNLHHQIEQSSNLSAHSSLSITTATTSTTSATPKSNKTTANGNHKNFVNSNINMDKSDMVVNAISRDKMCSASDLFLSKDVKID